MNRSAARHAAVEIDGGHQRLERRGQHRSRHAGIRRHAFAEDQVIAQAESVAEPSAGVAADDDGLDLGQLAFGVFRVLVE